MTDSAVVELAQDMKRVILARTLGRLVHGVATAIGYALLGAAVVGFIHDRFLARESLAMHDDVRVLTNLRSVGELAAGSEEDQDFDGDGVADQVTIVPYRYDPVFGRRATDLLRVHSGRTGKLLLARGMIWEISFRGWYGDYDENGTVDLVVRVRGGHEVLGYVKELR